MRDNELNQVKKIVKRLTKRYGITSYRIDTVDNTVTIVMTIKKDLGDPVTRFRKTFHIYELLALNETDNRFYREFNILWLSKRGERI